MAVRPWSSRLILSNRARSPASFSCPLPPRASFSDPQRGWALPLPTSTHVLCRLLHTLPAACPCHPWSLSCWSAGLSAGRALSSGASAARRARPSGSGMRVPLLRGRGAPLSAGAGGAAAGGAGTGPSSRAPYLEAVIKPFLDVPTHHKTVTIASEKHAAPVYTSFGCRGHPRPSLPARVGGGVGDTPPSKAERASPKALGLPPRMIPLWFSVMDGH